MNETKILVLAALSAACVLSAPVERAAALSLSNPATATAVQDSAKVTTEVHWHGGGHHRGWHHGRHRGWHHHHWHHRHWHHHHWR